MVAIRPRPGSLIKRVLSYETLSETEWAAPFIENAFIPNVYVDISETLEIKRPGTGIEPKYVNSILGKRAKENIGQEETITFSKVT